MKNEIDGLFSGGGAVAGSADADQTLDPDSPNPPRHHHNRMRWSRRPAEDRDTPLAPTPSPLADPAPDDAVAIGRRAAAADPGGRDHGPGHDHHHGHAHAHGHAHIHDHGHDHDQDHDHDHVGAPRRLGTARRRRPPFSLVRLSLVGRLAIALTVSSGVWAAVVWAMRPLAE